MNKVPHLGPIAEWQPVDPEAAAGRFAEACTHILEGETTREVVQALRQGLHALGRDVAGLAWQEDGALLFEPAELEDAARRNGIADAGGRICGAPCSTCSMRVLGVDGMPAATCPRRQPGGLSGQLFVVAEHRMNKLRTIAQLEASVRDLAQAERLQRALFAIADLTGSGQDMNGLLRDLHRIIGGLMYAENFYIALYDARRESVRFIYFADEMDGELYRADDAVPAAQLANSITLALLRHGQAVKGPSREVARLLGLRNDQPIGTPSVDFMGVPMRRDGEVVGALVVQSYRAGIGYGDADLAVLGFVAEHVLNAVERKRSQEQLEQRVADRTRELATANARLQAEIAERERGEHLQATLYRIAALSHEQQDDQSFHRAIHQAVGEVVVAENFYIALLAETVGELQFVYSVDQGQPLAATRPLGRGLTEYVIRQDRTVLVDPAQVRALEQAGELDSALRGRPSLAWLGAPLRGPQGVFGVVAVQSYRPDLVYGREDANVLNFVASQIASSLLRRRQAEALHALNDELEARVEHRTRELRREILVREQVEAQLQHQVMHDPLTGLPNRSLLRQRLEQALTGHAGRVGQDFALLYLDVDRFKLFNDSYGHRAGDGVLCEIARRLSACVRDPHDVVARLSGDEFAILLQNFATPASAARVAERILARMQAPIRVGEHDLHASVSIGITFGRSGQGSVDALLHEADVALYRAKATGRQRYALFDANLPGGAINVLGMEQQLRRALAGNEFRAHFQPIVRLGDGRVVGYEALIRWQHPTLGLIGPGEFLPVAEETGLIEEIDWHMYRLACAEGAALLRAGGYLDVNVPPQHFQNEGFATRLLALLAELDFDPRQLRVEVTEGTLLRDPDAVAASLHTLHAAGVEAALDDFGTGYSSLGHIHRFPLRMVKIDQSFIEGIDDAAQQRSSAIVAAVLGLARALRLEVIAEGVARPGQREALLALGCDYGQGYHFGHAAPAAHWLSGDGANLRRPA